MGRGWKRVRWAEKSFITSCIDRCQEATAILIALFHQIPILIYRQSPAKRLHGSGNIGIEWIASEKTPAGSKTIRGSQTNEDPHRLSDIGRMPGLDNGATC